MHLIAHELQTVLERQRRFGRHAQDLILANARTFRWRWQVPWRMSNALSGRDETIRIAALARGESWERWQWTVLRTIRSNPLLDSGEATLSWLTVFIKDIVLVVNEIHACLIRTHA